MAFFIAPFSGNAVGGGGHGPKDPPPPAIKASKARFERRKKLKLDDVPPGQIPGPPPAYAWQPLERPDWFPPYSVTEDVPQQPGTPSPDPIARRREMLHKEADAIREKLAKLRNELQRELAASRERSELDRLKNAPSAGGSPLSGGTTIPKLPRATRPFAAPGLRQEWRTLSATPIQPGTPLHMRKGSMTLDQGSQRIVALRAEISKNRVRLAQIRQQLKQLKQMPKLQAPKAGPSGTQWTKKPTEHHTVEHHSRFVSRGQGWRSQLKMMR